MTSGLGIAGGFDGRPGGLDTQLRCYSTDGTAQPTSVMLDRRDATG